MGLRLCDGTDPNLTREISKIEFDPKTQTVSGWGAAHVGCVVIQCECGLRFNDEIRRVTWPHQHFPAGYSYP